MPEPGSLEFTCDCCGRVFPWLYRIICYMQRDGAFVRRIVCTGCVWASDGNTFAHSPVAPHRFIELHIDEVGMYELVAEEKVYYLRRKVPLMHA